MATATQTAPHEKHIDETIDAIETHVKDGSTSAITSVSSWMKTLESHEEFKGISKDLQALKDALSAKDGEKIVSLMEKLGAATTEAGQNAEGGENKKIKALGKALTAGAKAISKLK